MSTLADVHQILLKLLSEFSRVCNANNLEWFLDAGSLLGLMRDGKLIDWDDDADIVMPRASYNKLLALSSEFKHPFFLQTPLTDENYFSISIKLRYSDSAMLSLQELPFKFNKGICIDILPLDSIPEDEKELALYQNLTKLFTGRLSMRFETHKEVNPLLCNHKLNFQTIFNCWNECMTAMDEMYSSSKYYGSSACWWSSKYKDTKLNKQAYSSALKNYEMTKEPMNVPVGWKDILEAWYGDTWSIPQHEASCHSFLNRILYDTTKSYKDYLNMDEEELKALILSKGLAL